MEKEQMSEIRTDLAEEAAALAAEKSEKLPGVLQRKREKYGCQVTEVEIISQEGAKCTGKPMGRYVTIHLPGGEDRERPGAEAVAEELARLLEWEKEGSVLVAGLGNRDITPDAIGPWAVENILVTRHLQKELPGYFCPVSAVSTGVMGKTGVESGELLQGIVEKVRPSRVIAVDALAARSVERLCNTIQIADTGIVPGSGVGNARKALNEESLGIPVIAIGVPTVVDAATLAEDLTGSAPQESAKQMIVTPRDIDHRAAETARIIALGINLALHSLPYEETLELMK